MKRLVQGFAAAVLALGFSSGVAADGNDRERAGKPAFTQIKRVHGTIVDVAAGNPGVLDSRSSAAGCRVGHDPAEPRTVHGLGTDE
jgi:hypothetical protein